MVMEVNLKEQLQRLNISPPCELKTTPRSHQLGQMADGDRNLGVLGRADSPSLPYSSASTLSLSPPPDELPETWEEQVEMERHSSELQVSARPDFWNYALDATIQL